MGAILEEMEKVMRARAMPRTEALSKEDDLMWRLFALVVEVLEGMEIATDGEGNSEEKEGGKDGGQREGQEI